MLICGVDPGKKGGMVILDGSGSIVAKATMFLVNKTEFDPVAYSAFLKNDRYSVDHVLVEKVSAMPGNGNVSMFTFGQAFMFCQLVPKMLQIPITLVTPQMWQKVMHVGIEKTIEPKKRSLIAACRLFPNLDLRASERCSVQHDGLVDALLLAEWGRRSLNVCLKE